MDYKSRFLPSKMSIKFGFLVCTSSPPPVASALALVFREVGFTELKQSLVFSAYSTWT
ncbi:hypothetical protein [Bartonella sp. OC29QHQL]|uniref:hypothetical protein n=1 Tax=Bartonella sp. OC29QHQL TaxID=3243563 RepID=UPI0035D01F12